MIKQADILKRFLELVQIDSESKAERQIADKLKQELKELGLEVSEDQAGKKIGGNAGNIIAKLKGRNSELPTLLLTAHMDTVTPGQGIEPVIKDGVIYSSGDTILGADDKAGITAIMTVLETILAEENDLEYGNLEVVFTVCEEIGLLGAKNLDYSQLAADYGIVLDTNGEVGSVVIEGPAQNKIEAVINGEAAHAGVNPEEGVNAIKVASIALSNMNLGRIDEETTANIGVIEGGEATNIVPDIVKLEGEARSRDEAKLAAQTEHMLEILESSTQKLAAEIDINTERMYSAFELSKEEPLVKLILRAAERIEIEPKLIAGGGGSDANILNSNGIPAVNLSLGTNDVHSPEENIEIKDLVNINRYLLAIIEEWAAGNKKSKAV
ncbi:M20/M25/M40 family metallo-hydrolase [Fuchsiella alkaliacetigena]|uniref:M20/M25/M40 family metallo-hydrolase n=1 Tax=Fuchsiella alkaliacetigena TaxID=957042 RepID=UPI00200B9189|nr:M20/M25/M40 family metallo-hydrolase [Fuchsiella alkaliacetigena]MCK8824752.1 M20/M25/M40 family metallo-hydrolase [Fuchsiella alkaliacetigena]